MEKPIQHKRIWEFKQSVQPGTLDLYIYGDIQGDYFDWMAWEHVQSETSANFFREELAKYPDVTQINVYVNSYGGSAYEAISIRTQLKRHQAHVTGYCDGFACSSASYILTGCDEVIMYSNTMQFIHDISDVCFGNARQMRKKADDLDTIMIGNRQAYLEKSGGKITEEMLKELMEAETWLTAQQCLEYGFCDRILEKEVDLTAAKQMLQKVNMSFEQHLSYNKALTAQFRELSQHTEPEPIEPEPVEPDPPADPPVEPPTDPEPGPGPSESKTQRLLAALFR